MKKSRIFSILAVPFIIGTSLSSCTDDISPIGDSLFNQQVSVYVDSATFKVRANTIEAFSIDSRSVNNLLGYISTPEFGDLSASFVTRLLSASRMEIPDSITSERVDSMKMILEAPRATVIGDSLVPQQLAVYMLNRQLPDDIKSNFNPEGYYNPASPLASKNYTLSALAQSDSAFYKKTVLPLDLQLPKSWATDIFNTYRENPEVFQWPSSFNQKVPGIYVRNTFGKGCIAAIQAVRFYLYWHYPTQKTVIKDDEAVKVTVTVTDSICLFSSAPEVLSSNNLTYIPSNSIKNMIAGGENIITTPLGYNVRMTFPGKQLLDTYHSHDRDLSTINNLAMAIPASEIKNDLGITVPPNLLLIKTSEIDDFFCNGKVPDNVTSFYSTYSSTDGRYYFNKMRQMLVNLNDVYGTVSDSDMEALCDYTLIPVKISSEKVDNSDGTVTTYVTGCTPYQATPTMCRLDMDNILIIFTYTHQNID